MPTLTTQRLATRRPTSQPRSSEDWIAYFRDNLETLLPIPWERGPGWTPKEKHALTESLRDFQLGESSIGRHLIARAERHAACSGDAGYVEAMRLFVMEEQRHSRLLAQFLMLAGVSLAPCSKLDFAFRVIRRLAGLELAITTLLIAETIGKVYYLSVRRATQGVVLRRVCEQLLRDEAQHLRFHAERLASLRQGRGAWRLKLADWGQRLLFNGAAFIVWIKHRRAFRAGGLGFRDYWRQCREENDKVRMRSGRS